MKKNATRILVVDDDPGHRDTLVTLLSEWGYATDAAADGESAVRVCRESPFDLALMDFRMPGLNGVEALQQIKTYNPAIPVIIMTAFSDVSNAVDALKSGAYDYLTKPLDFEELKLTLARAMDHVALVDENRALKNALAGAFDPGGIVSQSRAMRRLLEMAAAVAPSEATVLIAGESGTGKELVAKMLHANSNRRRGPFMAVNCAALTETLLESELFGHERGAFTGAEKRRDGKFFAANKGTIFLDEVGEMSLPMQAKLLRAIQEREVQRVGGDQTVKVDVRILAATNRDLAAEAASGGFRQDLFYRLNVVSLELPALRERQEDIPLLAAHFLRLFAEKNGKTIKGFTPAAMDKLVKHAWPGNVRELENTVERAVVLLMGEYISDRELPPCMVGSAEGRNGPDLDLATMTLDAIERVIVAQVVDNVGGNKSEAARRLGITRKTLVAKMQPPGLAKTEK